LSIEAWVTDPDGVQWSVREISLTKGLVALVDDADYELVAAFSWHASRGTKGGWYARRMVEGRPHTRYISMHRFLLDEPAGLGVDHRNGNGLDNRRSNLRLATQLQNNRNQRISPDRQWGGRRVSSRYKGVTWDKNRSRWTVGVKIAGRRLNLGRFDDEEEAARAYDAAAREHYGEFARLNFENA
jgi:hypothetical protein